MRYRCGLCDWEGEGADGFGTHGCNPPGLRPPLTVGAVVLYRHPLIHCNAGPYTPIGEGICLCVKSLTRDIEIDWSLRRSFQDATIELARKALKSE